ncbi:LOB domain-containing protein 42 [Cajanus cajan]|uniref:LOB domain-containing protein 42 n=1 Tax=Cajanus cajan TaxID=3821 RepID=A0A151QRU9_CAJCA|nr:LOB domain-containing protein 42 [Cajanus cajan]KYP33029.1 LOB domain-containing protein 42 [Cajanus cajan]
MKMSCYGCRILRKGCPENCVIRPCLEWINSPEGQSNATLFLAKFYGRAGLLNLINAAPEPHRREVFKSLMFEACGRIVNPTYGSMGLFWTGEWAQCEAAVNAVINGMEASNSQITGTRRSNHVPQILGIRHVARDGGMDRVKGKGKAKRSAKEMKPKQRVAAPSREPGGSEGKTKSEQTVEALLVSQDKPSRTRGAELNLELTLG